MTKVSLPERNETRWHNSRLRAAIASILVGVCVLAGVSIAAPPAHAAGSWLRIGTTIWSGGYVKGSGSMYNSGDYSNVCVVIMHQTATSTQNKTQACKSQLGTFTWSAPDFRHTYNCFTFYTRITAYRNGNRVDELRSNTIRVGSSC